MHKTPLGSYRVEARNTSRESDNKIHDDAVARRFGFVGGLVPGVDVYGYMAHPPVARWGRAWLERGGSECRLLKPVYDGDIATVTASETEVGLDLAIESRGEICATGRAFLMETAPAFPALLHEPPAPPETRPPADESNLAAGRLLAMRPLSVTREFLAQALEDVRETDPLYAREGLVHPGTILRVGNWVLNNNVVLGPWMHVGSTVQHFAAARTGDELGARARITGNYERKGHQFVEVDVQVLANGATPVARIAHVAIWRPRQLAAA
jgi:hypothetical protein